MKRHTCVKRAHVKRERHMCEERRERERETCVKRERYMCEERERHMCEGERDTFVEEGDVRRKRERVSTEMEAREIRRENL